MQEAEYRFFLNGTLIADTPIGWRDTGKRIKRDDKYKALFVEYIPDLEWHSTGYDFISNLITNGGFCQEIKVIIEERKSEYDPFTNYFVGVIRLMEIDVDEERRIIRCNVEDDTLSALIKSRDDIKVRLDAVKTLGGQTLTPATLRSLSIHDSSTFGVYLTRSGYFLWDVFQMVLSYITDNRCTFESSYLLSAVTNRVSKTITFTNPGVDLIAGAPVVIKYRNFFNQVITVTVAKAGTVGQTLADIVSNLNFNTNAVPDVILYLQQNYIYPPLNATNGTNAVSMTSDLPFEILSITGAATLSSSLGTSGTPTDGMGKASIMSGSQLRGVVVNPVIPEVSFSECFEELNKYSNIGMQLTFNTTTNKAHLKIEKLSYFLQKQQALSITNVKGLKYTLSKKFNNDTIKVGQDNKGMEPDQYQEEVSDKGTWGSPNCTSRKLDLENRWIADHKIIGFQKSYNNSQSYNNDEKVFLLEMKASTVGTDAETVTYKNVICTNLGTNASITHYVLNVHLTNYWKLLNHLQEIIGNPQKEGKEIINTRDIQLIKEYDFTHGLTESQRTTLLSSVFQFIEFNEGTDIKNAKIGFIEEVSLDNEKSKCSFKLLTQ